MAPAPVGTLLLWSVSFRKFVDAFSCGELWVRETIFHKPIRVMSCHVYTTTPYSCLPASEGIDHFLCAVCVACGCGAYSVSSRANSIYATCRVRPSQYSNAAVILLQLMLTYVPPVLPRLVAQNAGYKNANPTALARELAILGRMEQRRSSAGAHELPMLSVADADVGDGGKDGFAAAAVGSLSAREQEMLGVVFGDGFGKLQGELIRRQREEEQQQRQQQEEENNKLAKQRQEEAKQK